MGRVRSLLIILYCSIFYCFCDEFVFFFNGINQYHADLTQIMGL